MNSRKDLMVVADDYGISEAVDLAILEKIDNQEANVVSILSNLVSKNSIEELRKRKIEVAAHLNIVEGRPLTALKNVPSLVSRNGCFYNLPIMLLRLFLNKVSNKELELELNNQIKNLSSLGLKIKYLNSHQHILSLPRFTNLKTKLLRKHGIKSFRSSISILYNFRNRPISIIMIKLTWMLDRFLVGEKPLKNNCSELELIIHPGTNYDKRLL